MHEQRLWGPTELTALLAVQEQLVASGDRERELQRQLTQAGLQAEALLEGSQAAAAAESEQLVKGLIQQRDTANEALLVGSCPVCACMSSAGRLSVLPSWGSTTVACATGGSLNCLLIPEMNLLPFQYRKPSKQRLTSSTWTTTCVLALPFSI